MTAAETSALSPDPDAARADWLRVILCAATLGMVALSWPLWIDLADFPAVPLVRWFPDYPRSWSWLGLALIVAGLGLGMSRRLGRVGISLAIAVMSWLILGDQLRLQPWVYEFLVLGTLIVALPPRSALGFANVWMASIYFQSGLSKLDTSFTRELGPLFVQTLAHVSRLERLPFFATRGGVQASILLMPAVEILVAILLLIRPVRRLGYLGAVLIHVASLLILGPWGLGHSTIVLVWNVVLAVEGYVLFWPRLSPRIKAGRDARPTEESSADTGPRPSAHLREKLVAIPFACLLFMPFTERIGLFDSWPSHALYASHCEGAMIYFREGVPDVLPADLRIATQNKGVTGWVLNPSDWARRVRGVPAYPQVRYLDGLAEWIAGRLPEDKWSGLFVFFRRRSDPWTGQIDTLSARNLKETRELADQFWFNAHPRDRSGR